MGLGGLKDKITRNIIYWKNKRLDADNPVNQSELKANTCSQRQARENPCE